MERKTKHRVLGFAVIAAVLVILFPFVEKEKGLPPQTERFVTPPPFPTPANAASTAPASVATPPVAANEQPDDTIAQKQPVQTTAAVDNIIPIIPLEKQQEITKEASTASNDESTNGGSRNILSMNSKTSQIVPANSESSTANSETSTSNPNSSTLNVGSSTPNPDKLSSSSNMNSPSSTSRGLSVGSGNAQPPTEALQHDIESELFNIKSQIVSNTHKKIAEFTEVKPMAWVVQLGVFKEKNNALKLVNQLRANGYRAFIANNGEITKVFVGPENKQNAAHILASRLEQEMHIHGIVINYKPFTL